MQPKALMTSRQIISISRPKSSINQITLLNVFHKKNSTDYLN